MTRAAFEQQAAAPAGHAEAQLIDAALRAARAQRLQDSWRQQTELVAPGAARGEDGQRAGNQTQRTAARRYVAAHRFRPRADELRERGIAVEPGAGRTFGGSPVPQ